MWATSCLEVGFNWHDLSAAAATFFTYVHCLLQHQAPTQTVRNVNTVNCLCVSALMCIVKPDGPPQLCKTDEIGEIVINSRAGGTMYYGLPGVTKNTFEVC